MIDLKKDREEYEMHWGVRHLVQFFNCDGVSERSREGAQKVCDVALRFARNYPTAIESVMALRRLLDAKDAIIRAPVERKKNNSVANLIQHVLQYFELGGRPRHMQSLLRPISELAVWVADRFPESTEAAICLRKLLEARDCMMRASLPSPTLRGEDQ